MAIRDLACWDLVKVEPSPSEWWRMPTPYWLHRCLGAHAWIKGRFCGGRLKPIAGKGDFQCVECGRRHKERDT